MDWVGLKTFAESSGLAKDALHIYFAFLIQIGAAFALRLPLSSWKPWLMVLGIELVNELLDIVLTDDFMFQTWQLEAARHDVLNTMILPTALLFLCRHSSRIFISNRENDPAGDGISHDGLPTDEGSSANPIDQAVESSGAGAANPATTIP